jgi:hypothetical protein
MFCKAIINLNSPSHRPPSAAPRNDPTPAASSSQNNLSFSIFNTKNDFPFFRAIHSIAPRSIDRSCLDYVMSTIKLWRGPRQLQKQLDTIL